MKEIKLNRSIRYLILACVFLVAVVALLAGILVRQSSAAMIDLIQNRMLDISNTAASMLDGDALEKLTAEDADSPEYQAVLATLTHFQDNIDLRYIYCIRDMGNREFTFTVDPTVEDPGEFGEPIVYTDALYAASLGSPAVDSDPYEDKWGRFYSAYSPVFDSAGKVAGIVAVDFSADWFDQQVARLRRSTMLVGLLTLITGELLIFAISSGLRKRVRALYAQLNGLADSVENLLVEVEGASAGAEVRAPDDDPALRGDEIRALGNKIVSMESALKEHVAYIRSQAYVDALTQFGNKAAYMDAVQQMNRRIEQKAAVFSVCVFDLNGLKTINDSQGHECGDQALMDLASVLGKVFRREDLYRVGGDEFIAILKEGSEKAVDDLFRRLDRELAKFNKAERAYQIPLSVSKGFAVFRPDVDSQVREVFRRADEVMYADKAAYYATHGDRRRQR